MIYAYEENKKMRTGGINIIFLFIVHTVQNLLKFSVKNLGKMYKVLHRFSNITSSLINLLHLIASLLVISQIEIFKSDAFTIVISPSRCHKEIIINIHDIKGQVRNNVECFQS